MLINLLIQIALPVALLLWLALRPVRNPLAYTLQFISVGLLLAAIGLVGMWMMIPWWTPYLYGLAFILISLCGFWRGNAEEPTGRSGWIERGVFVCIVMLSGYGAFLGGNAILGRRQPESDVVDIASPLESGTYLVAQGGSRQVINGHLMTLDTSVPRFAAWRGQSMGLDIVRLNGFGLRANGLQPSDPTQYFAFGKKVSAPCNGRVVQAVDGIADMTVPQMDRANMLGNYVILNCGDFFVIMAHFRNGSLVISENAQVVTGMYLGEIGNSGNSGEPHLHIHAQKDLPGNEPISGQPLPITLNGRFYVRNDRIFVE